MKKIISILLVMLTPVLLLAQETKKEAPAAAAAPAKRTLSTYRVFPKDGHTEALKAALTAHAAKFHTGNWKWRVYEILTGPDGGGYMIAEGPNSWTDIEGRGDLGAEHSKDYETNVLPHLEKSTPESYTTYQSSASTVAAGAFSTNKVLIERIYPKQGHRGDTYANLKDWKKVWEKLGINVAVWSSFYSGEHFYSVAGRLKDGFKDLDDDSINFRKAADSVFGAGGYDRLVAADERNVEKSVGEIIEFRPELSSK